MNCSYCNKPLKELEELFAQKYVHEIPLCAECIEEKYINYSII